MWIFPKSNYTNQLFYIVLAKEKDSKCGGQDPACKCIQPHYLIATWSLPNDGCSLTNVGSDALLLFLYHFNSSFSRSTCALNFWILYKLLNKQKCQTFVGSCDNRQWLPRCRCLPESRHSAGFLFVSFFLAGAEAVRTCGFASGQKPIWCHRLTLWSFRSLHHFLCMRVIYSRQN